MKVTGIIGSPNTKGNSAFIVKSILDKAKENGHDAESMKLAEMKINACRGCFSCMKNQTLCVQNDEMQKAYEHINESEIIILGSPIYMWQMSGQSKIFTDRLMPYFRQGKSNGKKIVLTYTYKGSPENIIEKYTDFNSRMFEHLGFCVVGTIKVGNVASVAAENRPEVKAEIADLSSRIF